MLGPDHRYGHRRPRVADRSERVASAVTAASLMLAFSSLLIAGLTVEIPGVSDHPLALFEITPDPPPPVPPPPPAPERAADPRKEGAASPANITSERTEIVAPEPIVPRPLIPLPLTTAPEPDQGADATAGASDRPGPGTGSGGTGDGTGSGGSGDGSGAGGGTPPRRIAGRISGRDFPRAAVLGNVGGIVLVRYTVTAKGRATQCTIDRTSGNSALDEATCDLIEKRFRFAPSRDVNGNPRDVTIVEKHSWIIEAAPFSQ